MALNERNAGTANGDAERDPRLDRLYREAGRDTPPARLDAAILAAARRGAGARPRSLTSTLRRWHVPVSIAAVVIVSVSLVILVREEDGEQIVPAPVPAVAPPAEQPAAPGRQPALAEAARETTQPQAATPAPARREARDDASALTALGKLADSARPEPASIGVRGVESVDTPPEPGGKPSPRPLLPAPLMAEERAAAAPADAITASRIAGAPAAATEPMVSRSAPEAPQAKSMARAMQTKPPEQDRLPVWHGYEKEPPQKWLVRIEELKRQGRAVEAEEMLSEFKRRFPEHPLPLSSK
jgi:hypothetical protein